MKEVTGDAGRSDLGRPPKEMLFTKLTSAFGSQVGVLLFGMSAQIILARTLGPSGKGTFSLAMAVASTLAVLAHMSLSSANSHFAGRHPDHRRAMVGNSLLLAFLWGAIVTGVVIYLKNRIPAAYLPSLSDRLWGMVLVAIIPLLLFEFSNGLVLGLNWIRRFSLTLILKEALLLTGVGWLAYKGVLSVECAVAVWILACVAVAILQASSAWFRVGLSITVSPRLLWRMATFSLQSHTANVFGFLRLRFDWFMIDYFLDQRELGYYTIACMLIYALWYLPIAIAQVLIPHISSRISRDTEAGNELTPVLARLGTSVALLGALLLGVLGYPIILLLPGEEFLPAYPALLIMLPGGVMLGLARILAGDLIGRGLPKYSMVISISAFVINVVVNLIFIPKFGILGAAATASITHIFAGMMYVYFFTRVSGVRVRELLIMRKEDFTGLLHLLRHN
ncbi:polysaccharide biosynthesis C-terminal domain-containing protein [bacterium]|nr:polysaccharide biosynthesis C-terminal domain-containing protein [bacterium]